VAEKKPFQNIDGLDKLIKVCEERLKARGRINLRYSGTEPLARVMVEGESESLIGEIAEQIASVLRKEIGD
jgi:phosphoglucosamine mutase